MAEFEAMLDNFARDFKSFTDHEKNLAIETILMLCGPQQLRFLSDQLQNLVKRDFIKFLPTELAFNVLKFLDYQTLARCCSVSKTWNRTMSNYPEVWAEACKNLGAVSQKLTRTVDVNWKLELQKALRRLRRLKYRASGFAKRELVGHTNRVTALYYKDGLLASGKFRRGV
jgi:F-box/WD-40 domain protein 2